MVGKPETEKLQDPKETQSQGHFSRHTKGCNYRKQLFNTAGAAILIEGDLNYWFESGANRNVLLRNNIFEDFLASIFYRKKI
jgi:hypothetical protein